MERTSNIDIVLCGYMGRMCHSVEVSFCRSIISTLACVMCPFDCKLYRVFGCVKRLLLQQLLIHLLLNVI